DIDGPPQPMSTFNLVGNNTHLTGGTIVNGTSGNQVGTAAQPIDPKLSLVEDNGSGFQTCLPLKGSPAIDAGAASNLSQDQRGFFRSIDLPDVANAAGSNGTDIGALELQPPVVTNNADSGVGSLRLAINDAFDGTTIAVP